MRLVQYIYDGVRSVGLLRNDDAVIDLTEQLDDAPDNTIEFLNGGKRLFDAAQNLLDDDSATATRLRDVRLLAPVTGSEKIVGVGLNYRDHCREQGASVPPEPVIFSKFPSAVAASGDAIRLPALARCVDWETELAVVVGLRGRDVPVERAMRHVAGYAVANDVTARDWMLRNGGQALLAKSCDTFCPLGPALVTCDEVAEPHDLRVRCAVNGVAMQDGRTRDMIFGVAECVAWASRFATLRAGDVLLTGSPCGSGAFRRPPRFLRHGDTVRCEIDGVGILENAVVNDDGSGSAHD